MQELYVYRVRYRVREGRGYMMVVVRGRVREALPHKAWKNQ